LLTTILINFIFSLVLIVAAIFRYLKSKIKCKRKKEVQKGEHLQSKNEELPMKNNIEPPQVDVKNLQISVNSVMNRTNITQEHTHFRKLKRK
jgi:hypothetical protein